MKKLKFELTEWQVIVLRAAIEAHKKKSNARRHAETCEDILRELRKNDRLPAWAAS